VPIGAPITDLATNVVYYGDSFDILRRYLPDAAVDLVSLDPPTAVLRLRPHNDWGPTVQLPKNWLIASVSSEKAQRAEILPSRM
jgi:DNA modification methylase